MTKASVYSTDGSEKEKIDLPTIFDEEVREDLILRAFLSEQSETFQPKGSFKMAGLQTTARYVGRKEAYHSLKNRGGAMLPRELFPKGRIGRVRKVPYSVGGRRAHPPKSNKTLVERMNKREKEKALRSAVAATSDLELVKKRHALDDAQKVVPIVLDDAFEALKKTKDVSTALNKMKLTKDLTRSIKGRKKRTGRKGGKKTPKSVLIVTTPDKSLFKAARNIPGVDVTTAKKLKVMDLAPGGVAGRLTLWTKSSLKELK